MPTWLKNLLARILHNEGYHVEGVVNFGMGKSDKGGMYKTVTAWKYKCIVCGRTRIEYTKGYEKYGLDEWLWEDES